MSDNVKMSEKPYGTVLVKAKEILDYLLAAEDAPTLAEISQALEVPKPTVLKVLGTMDLLGLVRRDEQTKQYYLGTQLIPYAQKAIESFNIEGVAKRYLEELRDATGETINLGVVRDERIVLIEKLESPASIKLQSTVGGTMNLYSSAMGKAVLASYTPAQLQQYLKSHVLNPVTPSTITDPELLARNLEQAAQAGVAIDNEENEQEIFCIGATLVKGNQLYGAFSVSTPKYRLSVDRQREFEDLVKQTQAAIEAAL